MTACVGAEDGWNSQLGYVCGSCTGPSSSETNQSSLSLLHPCGRLCHSAAKPGLGTDGPSELTSILYWVKSAHLDGCALHKITE